MKNGKYKVLLVEDNYINQRISQTVLINMGYDVDLAIDGIDAIEKKRNNTYDIIFMDIEMPKMDGFQTVQIIREQEKVIPNEEDLQKHIPIIAMTGRDQATDIKKCIESGMDDYISKPMHMNELTKVLNKYLLSNQDPISGKSK